MLWRKGYETKKVESFTKPTFECPSVVVGISHLDQITDAELWMRLLDKDFPRLRWGILAFQLDLSVAIPKSRMNRVVEVAEKWDIDREFCLCVPNGLLMIGPPTEEAWDEFAHAIRVFSL